MSRVEQATLPESLREQAASRPHAVALRHKRRGQWRALSWQQVRDTVQRLAAALVSRGFVPGDRLMLVSQPGPETLLLALASQWAGGVAVPLDPQTGDDALAAALAHIAPRFVFADDDTRIDTLLAHAQRVIDANPRNLPIPPGGTVIDYRDLSAHQPERQLVHQAVHAEPHRDAFIFLRPDADGGLAERRFSHTELLHEAAHFVRAERLGVDDEAFAARAFAAPAQARYLIAPWVLTGFRLNFPEALATRDNDRRELQPTLVAGTRDTYARLAGLVDERLPRGRGWRRRLFAAALNGSRIPVVRLLARWLIARPLREVIGFRRTRAALVVGPALDDQTAALFKALAVDVRAWPEGGEWQRLSASSRTSPLQPGQSGVPFGQPA
jgi:long-chain acyl-CoA synthetase